MNYDPLQITMRATTAWSPRSWSFDRPAGNGDVIDPLNAELYPICYLLALLEAHHFLHVSRIKVKSLTFR